MQRTRSLYFSVQCTTRWFFYFWCRREFKFNTTNWLFR